MYLESGMVSYPALGYCTGYTVSRTWLLTPYFLLQSGFTRPLRLRRSGRPSLVMAGGRQREASSRIFPTKSEPATPRPRPSAPAVRAALFSLVSSWSVGSSLAPAADSVVSEDRQKTSQMICGYKL